MRRDLTQGSIIKALLTLALPIILANTFQTVYQLTDTFWVGRLGADAVASVSLSFPILFFLMNLGMGLTVAGSILVAQYKGKKDQVSVDYISAQTLGLMFVITFVLSIVGYFFSEPFIHLMGPEASVAIDAIKYLQISFLGFVFLGVFFTYQAVVRGVGDVRTPLYIVISTVLLNFILDPLFIYGWGPIPVFGVSGAALATITTEGLSAVIGVILLLGGARGIKLKLHNLKLKFSTVKKLFLIGFPTSIEGSSRALSMVIITFLVTVFGTTAIAAYGLGMRIFSFIIIPAIGLAMSTSTIVGQNFGAEKIERAEKTVKISEKIGFYSLSVIGVLLFIFAESVVAAFIPGDFEVIKESALFLRIMSLTFGFVGFQMGIIGALRGSGNTTLAMKLSIFTIIIMVTLAFILSRFTTLQEQGIWWSYAISNVTGALVGMLYIHQGKWKHKRIT